MASADREPQSSAGADDAEPRSAPPGLTINRRQAMAGIGAGAAFSSASVAAEGADPLSGRSLYRDVQTYDAQGEHRTGTAADDEASHWLARRLIQSRLDTRLQSFDAPLFLPRTCRIGWGSSSAEAFPAWPVQNTPQSGLTAALATAADPGMEGKIAVIRLPYGPGGTWARPGFGDAVAQFAMRGAIAIVAITEGPTGEVIALNVAPKSVALAVPVVIVGRKTGDGLWQAAVSGASATLRSEGNLEPKARATNVIGRRNGQGKTIVVSTPKSGWFNCAGERGTGIAIFLAMANWLARQTDSDLLFVAFSGHELDELGGTHFLKTQAPHPDQVRCWLHVGANAAMRGLSFEGDKPVAASQAGLIHRITVTDTLLPAATRTYASASGYAPTMLMGDANAVGELGLFKAAGYRDLAGLGGSNPLFHTRLDRVPLVTTPQVLEGAARSCRDFLLSIP